MANAWDGRREFVARSLELKRNGRSKNWKQEGAHFKLHISAVNTHLLSSLLSPERTTHPTAGSIMASPGDGGERRTKRQTRAPSKLDAGGDAGYNKADLARAIQASTKHQRRTSSAEMPECPMFRPTAAEFRDPFAYIKSISAVGAKAGIAKIVPPEGARAPPPPPPTPEGEGGRRHSQQTNSFFHCGHPSRPLQFET